MSLDVYLVLDARFPGAAPVVAHFSDYAGEVYSANVTHNLAQMADAAALYRALWRPEEIGIAKAEQLVPLLSAGLARLRAEPDHFKQFNPKNGWGDYDVLLTFVEDYLQACELYPDAAVTVCR